MTSLFFVVLVALVLITAMFLLGKYNKLVALRNRLRNAFAQIDELLKRRYDLIPKLVEIAKDDLKQERGTLVAVLAARNAASTANKDAAANPGDPTTMKQLVRAEGALAAALGCLFALSESHPELKANTTMQRLMDELSSTENRVSFARQAYNDSVLNHNTQRKVFPSSVIASIFHFAAAGLFVIENPNQRRVPEVSFS